MDTLRQNLLFYFKSFILFYLDLFYHLEKTVDACSFSTSEGAVVCTGKLSSQSLSHYTHTHTLGEFRATLFTRHLHFSAFRILFICCICIFNSHTQTQYMHVCMHMHPHRERVKESFLHSVHMCIVTSTQNYNLSISCLHWYH